MRRHLNTTPGNFNSLGSCLLPGIKKRITKQQQQQQRKFYTRKCDFNLLKEKNNNNYTVDPSPATTPEIEGRYRRKLSANDN